MASHKIKTGLQLLLTFIVLVFAPFENRIFWFHSDPRQQYGEFVIYSQADTTYVLAKNGSNEKVVLPTFGPSSHLSRDMRTGSFHRSVQSEAIYSKSYGLMVLEADSSLIAGRRIQYNDVQPFIAGSLSIATPAEEEFGYFLLGLAMLLASTLTFTIADYNRQSAALPRDESTTS